ncbi:MAG TPA: SGNH/GDSL hydrolase family protein [Solimonas sp.]
MVTLRALLKVGVWAALLWLLLMLPTYRYWPLETSAKPLHLSKVVYEHRPYSIFVSHLQEAVYKLASKCPMPPARTRLILLGGSGSQAFYPDFLGDATAADEVSNLSLPLANFTQIRQVYQDLGACLGADGLRNSTVVLIPSLMSFTRTGARRESAYSFYELEKLKTRLYRGEADAVTPRLPAPLMRVLVELWRPLIPMRGFINAVRDETAYLRQSLKWRLRPSGPAPLRERPALDRDLSLRLIADFLPDAGVDRPFAEDQVAELDGLVKRIRAAGSAVVIVDQPAQAWLREAAPAFAVARQTLRRYAQANDVPYIDLTETAGDDEFFDALHATPEASAIWTRRLADALIALQATQPSALGVVARRAGAPGVGAPASDALP